jgi:hypothetical protein
MTLLVGEVGIVGTPWAPNGGVRFAFHVIKDPNVDFYEMGNLYTVGKRYCLLHDGAGQTRLFKMHNTSTQQIDNHGDKYLPAVNDTGDQSFYIAVPRDYTLIDGGAESNVILVGQNRIVWFSIETPMFNTKFKFLTDVFIGAPETLDLSTGVFKTKTGFCLYGTAEEYRNF